MRYRAGFRVQFNAEFPRQVMNFPVIYHGIEGPFTLGFRGVSVRLVMILPEHKAVEPPVSDHPKCQA